MKFEKHHLLPLHLGGIDHPTNLVALPVEEHATVHRIMNIPKERFRSYHKKTNHILCPIKKLEEMQKMQREYAGNYVKLSYRHQKIHLRVIRDVIRHIMNLYDVKPQNYDPRGSWFYQVRVYQWVVMQATKRTIAHFV